MNMVQIDVVNNFFGLIVSILLILGTMIGLVAWFIRLESAQKAQAARISAMEKRQEAKEAALWNEMAGFRTSMNELIRAVTRVETKLEVRGD